MRIYDFGFTISREEDEEGSPWRRVHVAKPSDMTRGLLSGGGTVNFVLLVPGLDRRSGVL